MWSAATGGDAHTHTHMHEHSLFSSFAAVGISKCVSGEIEVFIITLYRGKGEAFKVAN